MTSSGQISCILNTKGKSDQIFAIIIQPLGSWSSRLRVWCTADVVTKTQLHTKAKGLIVSECTMGSWGIGSPPVWFRGNRKAPVGGLGDQVPRS